MIEATDLGLDDLIIDAKDVLPGDNVLELHGWAIVQEVVPLDYAPGVLLRYRSRRDPAVASGGSVRYLHNYAPVRVLREED